MLVFHSSIEKRVAGIIRWLERLKKSYSSGAIESALMDAECARADLETLRRDVWAKVQPFPSISTRRWWLIKAVSLSVIIVMAAAVPLSREMPAPVIEHIPEEIVMAEPIIVVRVPEEKVQEARNEAVTAKTPAPAKQRASAPKRQAQPKKSSPVQTQQTHKAQPAKTVPYDKVFSLLQTGQRALKNNSSVIKLQ